MCHNDVYKLDNNYRIDCQARKQHHPNIHAVSITLIYITGTSLQAPK